MEVRASAIFCSKRGRSLKYWLLPKVVFFITCYAALQSFFELKDIEITNHGSLQDKTPTSPTIVLFRVIGNSLPPLHSNDQSLSNLKYMLHHEQKLDSVKKVWIFNRIIDTYVLRELTDIIKGTGDTYFVFAFNPDKFLQVEYNHQYLSNDVVDVVSGQVKMESTNSPIKSNISYFFLNKNLHLMNNNGARNFALQLGIRLGYTWLLPWDGNCYITDTTWPAIFGSLRYLGQKHKYFLTYMIRVAENQQIGEKTILSWEATEEPQIIFRSDAVERFDDMIPYGRRSKVALLIRLKIEGDWNNWRWYNWERGINPHYSYSNDSTNPTPRAGFIIRLASGSNKVLMPSSSRFNLRLIAIITFIINLDIKHYQHRIKMVDALQTKYHGNGDDHRSLSYVFYDGKDRGNNRSHTHALLACLGVKPQKIFSDFMYGTKTKDALMIELQNYIERTYQGYEVFGGDLMAMSVSESNVKCMHVSRLPLLLESVGMLTSTSPVRPKVRALLRLYQAMKDQCLKKGHSVLSKASSSLSLFAISKLYPGMNEAGKNLWLTKLYASLLSTSTEQDIEVFQKDAELSETFVKYVVSLAFICWRYDLKFEQFPRLLDISRQLCDHHLDESQGKFNCWLKDSNPFSPNY